MARGIGRIECSVHNVGLSPEDACQQNIHSSLTGPPGGMVDYVPDPGLCHISVLRARVEGHPPFSFSSLLLDHPGGDGAQPADFSLLVGCRTLGTNALSEWSVESAAAGGDAREEDRRLSGPAVRSAQWRHGRGPRWWGYVGPKQKCRDFCGATSGMTSTATCAGYP